MNTKNSINESLEVIRRALEDEKNNSNKHSTSNILILNQKVNSDGTIKLLQKDEEINSEINDIIDQKLSYLCLLYTSPSPRDRTRSRMPSSA